MFREDYSAFPTENDLVYIYGEYSMHFNTHSIDFRALLDENGLRSFKIIHPEYPNGGFYIKEDTLYVSTHREDKLYREYSFVIYKCDLYGNNFQLVYEQNGYTDDPHAVAKDGIFYIRHSVKSDEASHGYITQIDTYDLSTGKYTSAITSGNDCSLEDYYEENESWQMVDPEQDYFEILLPGETESIIIDKDFMNATVYADSMNKYPYTPHKWGIVDGRVLLVYQSGNANKIVYEYQPDNHMLIYKMIGFWDEDEFKNDFRFIK